MTYFVLLYSFRISRGCIVFKTCLVKQTNQITFLKWRHHDFFRVLVSLSNMNINFPWLWLLLCSHFPHSYPIYMLNCAFSITKMQLKMWSAECWTPRSGFRCNTPCTWSPAGMRTIRRMCLFDGTTLRSFESSRIMHWFSIVCMSYTCCITLTILRPDYHGYTSGPFY